MKKEVVEIDNDEDHNIINNKNDDCRSNNNNNKNNTFESKDLLYLFIGIHDQYNIISPTAYGFEFLTVRDLIQLYVLSKTIRTKLQRVEYIKCRNEYINCRNGKKYLVPGKEYLVPFPGFPGILNTKEDSRIHSGLFQHQLASLEMMYQLENPLLLLSSSSSSSSRSSNNHQQQQQHEFNILRGGILGDAPGLGKTITMLALIASTAGKRPINPPNFWDEDGIKYGWNALRLNEACKTDILRTVKPIRNYVQTYYSIMNREKLAIYQQMERDVSPPYTTTTTTTKTKTKTKTKNTKITHTKKKQKTCSSKNNSNSNNNNNNNNSNNITNTPKNQFLTLRDFELYVLRTVRQYNLAPISELEKFRQNVRMLKAGLDKRNRKFHRLRSSWERTLLPTSATLLIVPDPLLEHWFQQILQHVNLIQFLTDSDYDNHSINDYNYNHHHHNTKHSKYNMREKDHQKNNSFSQSNSCRGVVYLDGIGDLVDASIPLRKFNLPEKPACDLSRYLIVVTTFSRCKHDLHRHQKNTDSNRRSSSRGSRSRSNSNNNRKRKRGGSLDSNNTLDSTEDTLSSSSSFLQLRWLRLVVDEGHELGTYETGNDVTQFIHQLAAERRWVLSGTPTTGDEDDKNFASKALDQLQRLLVFLRHPIYGKLPTNITKETAINYKDIDDDEDMISSTKKSNNIEQTKKNWIQKVKKPFLKKDMTGRKELLRVLREVMVMHHKEDINLPKPIFKQAEVDVGVPDDDLFQLYRQEDSKKPPPLGMILKQYLESPTFQSRVDDAQAKYIIETIKHAQKEVEQATVLQTYNKTNSALQNTVTDEYNISERWNTQMTGPRKVKAVVYSSEENNLLSVTEQLYRNLDAENIAEMYGDVSDVGTELSRFRNGYKQVQRCPICKTQNDVGSGQRSKGRTIRCHKTLVEIKLLHTQPGENDRFLIEPERICRALNYGEGNFGEVGNVETTRLDGEPLNQYYLHRTKWRVGDRIEVNLRDPHPVLCRRENETIWKKWGSTECKEMARHDDYAGQDWYFGPLLPEDRSDFVKATLVKWQSCDKFHRRWYDGPMLTHAPIETVEQNTFILALNQGSTHGLDLSFVTHIFLLESITDAALLEQVTSRAHRLGATGPVIVDTVNTFYQLSPKMDDKIKSEEKEEEEVNKKKKRISSSSWDKKKENDKSSLKSVVCSYCYKLFDSMMEAEQHEQTICPRNPNNIDRVDKFRLSSVYRNVRPPPPLKTGEQEQ